MTTQIRPVSYRDLINANRDFRNLRFGQIVSLMGDWCNVIATAILTAELTNSRLAAGALFVVRALVQFVIGPFRGMLADRFNRKWILIWADLLRCFIVLGFLLVKDAGQVWLLCTLTALRSASAAAFQMVCNPQNT